MGGVGKLAGQLGGVAMSQSPFLRAVSSLGKGQGIGGGQAPAFQPHVEGPSALPAAPINKTFADNVATLPPAPVVGQQKGGRTFEGIARSAAKKWGVDDNLFVKTLEMEGGLNDWIQSKVKKNGVREPSYGPGQFLIGGGNTGFPEGLGNRFIKDTGLDPRDPSNAGPYFDYMAKEVSQRGWGQWYGAKAAGITGMMGVGGRPVGGRSPMLDQVQGGTKYTPGSPEAYKSSFNQRMFGGDMTPGEAETGQKTALGQIAEGISGGGGRGGGMGVAQSDQSEAAPAVDLGAEEVAGTQQALVQRASQGATTSRAEQRKASIRQRLHGAQV